jgi:hypothetical protein
MSRRLIPMVFCVLALFGCQQKMARQPSYRPLEPSDFFPDGRSARPIVAGTVAQGQPLRDDPLLVWMKAPEGGAGAGGERARVEGAAAAVGAPNPLGAVAAAAAAQRRDGQGRPGQGVAQPIDTPPPGPKDYVNEFPFPIDLAALERGRQRFNIFCAVCHDETGHGRGKIVERGYTAPPSYVPVPGEEGSGYSRGFRRRGYTVLLRDVPVGYFVEVITQGYGAMPDYAAQVAPEDRWKIAAYIKALQLSQYADLKGKELPAAARDEIRQALEKQP